MTLDGLSTPEVFEQITGVEQDDATRPGAGWYHLYRARFPDRVRVKADDIPEGHRWIGGSALVLWDALTKR